jgi:hypothetical protein
MTNEIWQTILQPAVPDIDKMTSEEVRQMIWQGIIQNTMSTQQAGVGPNPPADLPKFFEMLDYAVKEQQKKDGEPHPIDVVENYPPTYKQNETITFSVRRREPGTFSKDKPFDGKKNYKPILRESYPDPENPGYRIQVLGLWFDNLVEIMCWALTNKAANARATWLENLMLSYAWYFRYNGVQQILYAGRESDKRIDVENIVVFQRPLLYYLRTEKLFTVSEKTIEDLLVTVELATPEEMETINSVATSFSSFD